MIQWKGQSRPALLLKRILTESQERLIILTGNPGVGKTTLVFSTLHDMYGEKYTLSSNFQFFRIDNYPLKLTYYLQQKDNPTTASHLHFWGTQFLLQFSQLLYLKEIKTSSIDYEKKKIDPHEFRVMLDAQLRENTFATDLLQSTSKQNLFLKLSEEVSSKKSIPIAFIHELIRIHEYSTDEPRTTLIGSWENATIEAQNASLKLFEEMPKNSNIILHTSTPEKILPTILSRSLVLSVPPLSPTTVKEILGTPLSFHQSCSEAMRESVYREQETSLQDAHHFLSNLAPHIQHNREIFPFIEKITETNDLTQAFLDTLIHLLREQWLHRQKALRNLPTEASPPLPFTTYTTEVKEWSHEITRVKNLLSRSSIQSSYILTNLLINLARWVQKRKIV